jgi:hypothetical protein
LQTPRKDRVDFIAAWAEKCNGPDPCTLREREELVAAAFPAFLLPASPTLVLDLIDRLEDRWLEEEEDRWLLESCCCFICFSASLADRRGEEEEVVVEVAGLTLTPVSEKERVKLLPFRRDMTFERHWNALGTA